MVEKSAADRTEHNAIICGQAQPYFFIITNYKNEKGVRL